MSAPRPPPGPVVPDDPDATVVRPPPGADADPEATVVRPVAAARASPAADPDATVVRGAPPLPVRRPLALPAGLRLFEYRIERVLGQGGFGITYLATDVHLDAQVAVKEYLPESIAFRAGDRSVSPNASRHRELYRRGLDNFLAEARTLATFRHPHIVRVARFFEAHRTAYMVLEYERGTSLREWWPRQRQADGRGERLLVERLGPLLDGLAAVHAAGYLHRDIKPDNIQVREDDGGFVLLDFGAAGQTALALGDDDAVALTPGYAPVEQYGLGEQGPWTDLYAFGATLYWAIAGDKPPDAEARAGGAPLVPAVERGAGRYGRAFLEAIDWALQMDPAARPQSVVDWRARLFADHDGRVGLQEALARAHGPLVARAASEARSGARRWLRRLAAPAAWPLAVKLSLTIAVTALAPMLLTGLYNLDGAQRTLHDAQLRKVELLAHDSAGRVGQLLADGRRRVGALAADAELARWLAGAAAASDAALAQRLQALADADPAVAVVKVLDAGGRVRLSTDPALQGRDLGEHAYFREAVAGRPSTSDISMAERGSGTGVSFAQPVRDGGTVRGVAVLRLHASAFTELLDAMRHDAGLMPFLVDADGVVVHHTRAEAMFRSLRPLPPAVQQRIRDDHRFPRDRIDSLDEPSLAAAMVGASAPGHVSYRSTLSGVDEVAGFAPVPGHDWTVGVAQTHQTFMRPLDELMTHLQWSLVLVGLLFTGLALRAARGIVGPLGALSAGAEALKAGRFDEAIVDVKARDELGQLARTFNVMVDVLRQRDRERSARG